MNPFYIQFTQSQNGPSPAFMTHILQGLYRYYISLGGEALKDPVENSALANVLHAKLEKVSLPLVEQDSFPKLSEEQENRINMTIDCAIDILNEVIDPYEGEIDVQYAHSYLSDTWKEFEKGTGAITRSSSEGIVYFLFPNTVISPEGQINQELPRFPVGGRSISNAINFMKNSHRTALLQAPYDSLIH